MSKIIMMGDLHLGLGYPKNHSKWTRVAYEYIYDFFIPKLKEIYEDGDIVIQLGDLFNNRNIIPIDTLNLAQKIIYDISNIAPMHIIVGNHDLWNKSSREINTINLFQYMKNVYTYSDTTEIKVGDYNICFMPYIQDKQQQIEMIKSFNHCDYLFCHSDLAGARMHLTSIANRNYDKIDVSKFSKFKHVYSGHIHIHQKNKNFTFVGSAFEMDRNDLGNQKGIYVLDLEKNKDVYIENNISPRFELITIYCEDDLSKLDTINKENFVDLHVSSSLVSDRKVRRKLEKYLKEDYFENIKFLDDVIIEESIVEEVSHIDIIGGNLDYDEMILQHLQNTEFDSTNVKTGVISSYNEIIEIYRNSK